MEALEIKNPRQTRNRKSLLRCEVFQISLVSLPLRIPKCTCGCINIAGFADMADNIALLLGRQFRLFSAQALFQMLNRRLNSQS